jgi:hypothetical protein
MLAYVSEIVTLEWRDIYSQNIKFILKCQRQERPYGDATLLLFCKFTKRMLRLTTSLVTVCMQPVKHPN